MKFYLQFPPHKYRDKNLYLHPIYGWGTIFPKIFKLVIQGIIPPKLTK